MSSLIPEEILARFHDSFERVTREPGVFDSFYERFLASSDEIARKFDGVDLRRIKSMLRESLYLTLLASDGNRAARTHLEELAAKHAARQIRPEHYRLWLESLLSVVEEFDPRFDARVEESWRAVLDVGIGIMLEAAHQPR